MMSGLPGGCNPADVLFKLAHARGISAPVFVQVSEQGPPHDKTFSWSCSFLQGQYNSLGQGRSKKEARNASAKSLITQLDLSTLPQVRESCGFGDDLAFLFSETTETGWGEVRR